MHDFTYLPLVMKSDEGGGEALSGGGEGIEALPMPGAVEAYPSPEAELDSATPSQEQVYPEPEKKDETS